MGAVYDIDGMLRYSTPDDVVIATRNFIKTCRYADFSSKRFTNIEDALKAIFTERGLRIKALTDTAVSFTSGFDASYGWESVMMEWFESVASVLGEGSTLDIYPDNGHNQGIVNSSGGVNWLDTEDEEDFDGDDDWDEESDEDEELNDYDYVDPDSLTDPLEKCIAAIDNYSVEEFGDTAVNRDKLDEVGLLYTQATDNDLDVQITANLVNPSIKYEIWGVTSDGEDVSIEEVVNYNSLEDLYDNYLYSLYWDDLYSDVCSYIPDEYYD